MVASFITKDKQYLIARYQLYSCLEHPQGFWFGWLSILLMWLSPRYRVIRSKHRNTRGVLIASGIKKIAKLNKLQITFTIR
jgi:hypothetical protein